MVYRRLKTDLASRFSLAPRQLLANAAIAAATTIAVSMGLRCYKGRCPHFTKGSRLTGYHPLLAKELIRKIGAW